MGFSFDSFANGEGFGFGNFSQNVYGMGFDDFMNYQEGVSFGNFDFESDSAPLGDGLLLLCGMAVLRMRRKKSAMHNPRF